MGVGSYLNFTFNPAVDTAGRSELGVDGAGDEIVPEAVDEPPAVVEARSVEDSSYCLRGAQEDSGAPSPGAARMLALASDPSGMGGAATRPQLIAASISSMSAAMLFGWDAYAQVAPSSPGAPPGSRDPLESILILAVSFALTAIAVYISRFTVTMGGTRDQGRTAAAGARAPRSRAKDHFSVLGLAPSWEVTDGELKRAMRSLVIRLHPDRPENRDNERCAAMFREVMDAYNFLNDPQRREQHLRTLGIPEPIKKEKAAKERP